MRQPKRAEDDEQDDTLAVLVPALHAYLKTSALPALARLRRTDVLRCDDPVCAGQSQLEIAERGEVDPRAARALAARHNMATTEQIARRVLSAAEPRDAWWETCRAGADMSASLAGSGISLPSPRWLRQWLDLGFPCHRMPGPVEARLQRLPRGVPLLRIRRLDRRPVIRCRSWRAATRHLVVRDQGAR